MPENQKFSVRLSTARAELGRRPGHRGAMIACAGADQAAGALLGRQTQYTHQRAAGLEGADGREALALQPYVRAGLGAQAGRVNQGRRRQAAPQHVARRP